MFDKIVICGVGLIGGSFAAALKRAGAVQQVVGIGRRASSLQIALELGLIDEIATEWKSALRGADLLLVATPVGQMDAIFAALAPHLEERTLVTDAGSTKRDVIEAMYAHLGKHLAYTVPAHPIAGAEKSGPQAALPDLYENRKVVITPLPENSPQAVETLQQAWRICGALVYQMSPQEHDRVFAAVSHLPHLLAFALVHELHNRANAPTLFRYAASGFRDFTRIAGSHPEMWRDIAIANRHALLAELDAYLAELSYMRALLAQSDEQALEAIFMQASTARNAWQDQMSPDDDPSLLSDPA